MLYGGINYVPLDAQGDQQIPQPRTYLPPSRVVPTQSQCEEILSNMTAETTISNEEMQLIAEAQTLGWTWNKIATVFRGRTVNQLRRILGVQSKAKRAGNPKRDDPRPTARERQVDRQQEKSGDEKLEKQDSSTKLGAHSGPASGVAHDLGFGQGSQTPTTTEKKQVSVSHKRKDRPKAPQPKTKDAEEYVNTHATNRAGGDARVTLKKPIGKPPKGFSGIRAHGLTSLDKVKFFGEVDVVDPDDPAKIFSFVLSDPAHCACFNIGVGQDGSPLLSWSDLYSFYELPDGTKWAEHGYLYDAEDLENHAKKIGKNFRHLLPKDMNPRELLKKKGRYHSKLQNIEFECWIYNGELPKNLPPNQDAYYWKTMFDPETMAKVDEIDGGATEGTEEKH